MATKKSKRTSKAAKKPAGAKRVALHDLSLKELVAKFSELGGGKVRASAFKSREEAIARVRALKRKIGRAKPAKEGTLRERAEELLLDPKPYSAILEQIKKEFPDARTSRSSLRWYAAQMRARGERVPERPLDVGQ